MFALRRLTLPEVKDAIIVSSAIESDTFVIPKDIDRHRVRLLRNRITARCGDLLEIKPPFVQLVHENVRDFLQREVAGPFIMNDKDGNDGMLSVCVRYLKISLTRDTVSDSSTKTWEEKDYAEFLMLINDRPFLDYVISFLPSHLKLARRPSVMKEWQPNNS
ncbi:hypothetical protein F4813DRAFT_357540 [Daldinia decipiens]|uniref:uncharacterized protein n=1 Tax=Daldinia decipiens TaxID=326647 RepID=UPI0020C3EE0A|nr:uncharacterized protein F4813DRAFT_357540 [Daldinia decipiens]KAI1658146.1 hypothetical protein F4813DRAFT_357540 [Daldinia decipiens]